MQVLLPTCRPLAKASRFLAASSHAGVEHHEPEVQLPQQPPAHHYVNLCPSNEISENSFQKKASNPENGFQKKSSNPLVSSAGVHQSSPTRPAWLQQESQETTCASEQHAASSSQQQQQQHNHQQGQQGQEQQFQLPAQLNHAGLQMPAQQAYANSNGPAANMRENYTMLPMGYFPATTFLLPVMVTNAGCFSTANFFHRQPLMQQSQMQFQPQQQHQQQQQQQQSQQFTNAGEALASSTATESANVNIGGRTGASRKQRKKQRSAATSMQAGAVESPGPAEPGLLLPRSNEGTASEKQDVTAGPVLSALTTDGLQVPLGDLVTSEVNSVISTNEGFGQQLWPPTPEDTPPCTPRIHQVPAYSFGQMVGWGLPEYNSTQFMTAANDTAPANQEVSTSSQDNEEAEHCEKLLAQLNDADERSALMAEISMSAWSMACTAGGTRVVQKAMEVATNAERIAIAEQLRGHVKEALASPHANHVLQQCIELIAPERMNFVLTEMQGHVVTAARHRYGCRVLERLLEHCPTEQTQPLIDEVLDCSAQLCRHTFGNFVIQHVLEHGTPSQRRKIAEVIHDDVQRLARHRVASHVVRCALKHCLPDDQQRLIQALRADPSEFADLAHHHCGSFVVREMKRADGLRR
eukprot:TRINITY_DN14998_c0_g1_i1.p1 TRINITY_DN14998_c0_g1~~TRINITY_DN14998_c0_g1_i1.p1  ORF type:complete len:638 (-),score=145.32 TRINITY_DN14998_c0_g1_i1:401-2314(-)